MGEMNKKRNCSEAALKILHSLGYRKERMKIKTVRSVKKIDRNICYCYTESRNRTLLVLYERGGSIGKNCRNRGAGF